MGSELISTVCILVNLKILQISVAEPGLTVEAGFPIVSFKVLNP